MCFSNTSETSVSGHHHLPYVEGLDVRARCRSRLRAVRNRDGRVVRATVAGARTTVGLAEDRQERRQVEAVYGPVPRVIRTATIRSARVAGTDLGEDDREVATL